MENRGFPHHFSGVGEHKTTLPIVINITWQGTAWILIPGSSPESPMRNIDNA